MRTLSRLGAGLLAVVVSLSTHAQETNPMVRMDTSLGEIRIEMFADQAPKTVDNFLTYVRDGFYDGTIFHRVIPGFVIQGGGFTEDFDRKSTRDPIRNEADNGLDNERGTLSMARTSDPNSATSQFFVNLSDNKPLDQGPGNAGYAVFGRVVAGMEVIDKIAALPTGAAGPFRQDAPQETALIESAEVIEP
ncbi:peptidylprolyl isomerase [Spectribacter hydrogenoxidans]